MDNMTEEERIEMLIGTMDDPLPEITQEQQTDEPISPTLAELEASRRPSPEVVCGTCPNSVWFASPNEVKCYCRVMFLVTWSTSEPNQITNCDGVAMA